MGKPLIIVGSITYAMKARDILNKVGIISNVVRTPRKYVTGSCNYSLNIKGDVNIASETLEKNGIKVIGIAYWEEGI